MRAKPLRDLSGASGSSISGQTWSWVSIKLAGRQRSNPIGSFESFMRSCEIWHLNTVGAIDAAPRQGPLAILKDLKEVRSGDDFSEVLCIFAGFRFPTRHTFSTYVWDRSFSLKEIYVELKRNEYFERQDYFWSVLFNKLGVEPESLLRHSWRLCM